MLPAQWFVAGGPVAKTVSSLNLTFNRLIGSIPAAGSNFVATSYRAANQKRAANLVLSPMANGTGICGPIASNMNITNSTNSSLLHQMPAGPCPGQQTALQYLAISSACMWRIAEKSRVVQVHCPRPAFAQIKVCSHQDGSDHSCSVVISTMLIISYGQV